VSGLNLRIACLGDSITFGQGSADGNGYRADLLQLLSGSNVLFIGSQRNGEMSNNQNEGWSGYNIAGVTLKAPNIYQGKPNVVLLHLGTNDMHIAGQDVAGAPQRLSALIDQIFNNCPDVTIIVASIIMSQSNDAAYTKIPTYNEAISALIATKIAAGAKLVHIDMQNILTSSDYVDSLHPNSKGYAKMANAWLSGIQAAASLITEPSAVFQGVLLDLAQGSAKAPVDTVPASCVGTITWNGKNNIGKGPNIGISDTNSDSSPRWKGSPNYAQGIVRPPTWRIQTTIGPFGPDNGSKVVMIDMDGDGYADYVRISDNGQADGYKNPGPGGGEWAFLGTLHAGTNGDVPSSQPSKVHLAEIDGNGKGDYIVSSKSTSPILAIIAHMKLLQAPFVVNMDIYKMAQRGRRALKKPDCPFSASDSFSLSEADH